MSPLSAVIARFVTFLAGSVLVSFALADFGQLLAFERSIHPHYWEAVINIRGLHSSEVSFLLLTPQALGSNPGSVDIFSTA